MNKPVTIKPNGHNPLMDNELFLEALINQGPDAIYITDLNGQILDTNQMASEQLGFSKEEFLQMGMMDLHPDTNFVETVRSKLKEIPFKTSLLKSTTHVKKDGSYLPVEIKISKIEINNAPYVLGFVRDISNRIEQQKKQEELFERNQLILETTLDGFILACSSGKIIRTNRSYQKMTGYDEEELLEMTIMELEASLSSEEIHKKISRMLAAGGARFETAHLKKNGDLVDLDVSISIMNMEGKSYFAAFCRDISQQKKAAVKLLADITKEKLAEIALTESEKRFRNIFEQAGDGIALHDLNGNFIEVNQKLADMFGYTREEFASLHISQAFAPTSFNKKMAKNFYKQLIQGGPVNLETEFKTKSGKSLNGEVTSSLVGTADNNMVLVMFRDSTKRKKAEHALKESERQYRNLVENATSCIHELDLEGRFLSINSAGLRMLALSEENQIIGKKYLNYICDEERNGIKQLMKQVIQDGISSKFEFLSSDYQTYFSACFIPIFKNGKIEKIMGLTDDITERKQIENELDQYRDHLEQLVQHRTQELESANKELESFSYSVSHDLRAPLTRIEGFSKALQESNAHLLNEKGIHFLNRIRASSKNMATLINEMLHLSMVTKKTVKKKEVDLGKIAQKVIDQLKETEEHRVVQLELQSDLTASMNPGLAKLMLENLLGNAWKFTRKETNAVIEMGKTEKERNTWFFIKDNGIGFDMKYYDQLFTPFMRLHSSAKIEGTGIGLATVQRIIHKHKGEIKAEGEPGKGAIFYFKL